MTLNTRHKKATTAATVVARIKSKWKGIEMMNQSLTVTPTFAQVIADEANRVIRTLSLSQPADRTSVESALESLKAVADSTAPALAKTLHIRLVAIRNNIKVNQVEV
ncbi:hypothetical protein [Shewanella subflava]|uniref:Uncharacterized protein n=1 Tax=Shewanella subflava TaxID=2986476 RepID=A0ABT3I594_9GAMM|nr:hypothetical protein [Shewanella subflava]MCW3171243.1 hypothetical protein [Shewanella subflava]